MNSNLEAEVYALSRSLEQVTTAHAPCAAEILSLRRQTEEMERETKLLEEQKQAKDELEKALVMLTQEHDDQKVHLITVFLSYAAFEYMITVMT